MKTRKDAERVVRLCEQREQVHKLAGKIRTAQTIGAYAPPNGHPRTVQYSEHRSFEFTRLADELRELVKREAAEQIAAIDEELKGLGIAPEGLGAASPESSGEWKVYGTVTGALRASEPPAAE